MRGGSNGCTLNYFHADQREGATNDSYIPGRYFNVIKKRAIDAAITGGG